MSLTLSRQGSMNPRWLVTLGWLATAASALAQSPVKISAATPAIELRAGATITPRLTFQIESGYHIYGTVAETNPRGAGPIPTTVDFRSTAPIKIDGDLKTSPPRRHFDRNFDMEVFTFEGSGWIDVSLKAAADLKPGTYSATLGVNYQACNEESCLPPAEIAVPFTIKILAAAAPAPAESNATLAKPKAGLDMSWPQYFDGKYWKTDISIQHAISSIPAMFLLDQDGKIVSTNARGPALETEVKRLLKL